MGLDRLMEEKANHRLQAMMTVHNLWVLKMARCKGVARGSCVLPETSDGSLLEIGSWTRCTLVILYRKQARDIR